MENLIRLDETDSTNSYLKARCRELPDGAAVTARVQTAGRGRRGHSWATNEGMLPLSVLLIDPPDSDTLTARTGLAVCEAVEETLSGAQKTAIKWPNDVVMGGFKLCGILCESVFYGNLAHIIVGIGVNISQDGSYFKSEGLPNAASLKMLTGEVPDREELLGKIIHKVKKRAKTPFSECYDEYKSRLVNLGREVLIISPNGERRAFAEDVSEKGFLICRDESGLFEVSSGGVSVRGTDGCYI